MKLLVTGGSGFIGRNYVLRRLSEFPNDQIINIDKLTYAANEEPDGILKVHEVRYKHHNIDICNLEALTEIALQFKPDAIVHFAAESHVDNSIDSPGEFITTNINGTYNLLQVARTLHADNPNFIFQHVSTDEVYGQLGLEDPAFTEETSYDPRSPYSASKASADHLVRAYYHTYGLPILITNCSNNYGPFQFEEKFIPKIITNALTNVKIPVYGKGENIRDWLYVEDHCNALNLVLEKGKIGETYNIGGGTEITNIELVKKILQLLEKDLDSSIEYVTDRPGHDFRYAIDNTKIVDLGWKPEVDFDSGLLSTIMFYNAKVKVEE